MFPRALCVLAQARWGPRGAWTVEVNVVERKQVVEKTPKENRFEFVVIASARARQLLRGALPRESGEKNVTIAQREVLSGKVEKIEENT